MDDILVCKGCGSDLNEGEELYCVGCQLATMHEEANDAAFEHSRDRETELQLSKRMP